MAHFIGLDLGGTNIKAGLVDDKAHVLASDSWPTDAHKGPGHVIDTMAAIAGSVASAGKMSLSQVDAIGIGSPGPMDFDLGTIKAMPNMPGWENVPLRDQIASKTGRPAVLENDANAAAFGEFWAGAGRDASIRHMVMLTLGTGIGTGAIVSGKLLHGAHGLGGEGGHMIVQPNGRQCGCGQRGCLETYASASHTLKRTIEALEKGEPSTLSSVHKNNPADLSTKLIFEAAKSGDALAERIVDETATYLAIGCINVCRWFDPQMIVFAGGMIAAGDYLFQKVRKTYASQTWKVAEDRVQLVPAQLGNKAGFIGAAAVAWDAAQNGRLA